MADILTKKDLQKVMQGNVVTTSIILRGNGVKTLGKIKQIDGDLGLSDSALESLGELRIIKGDFWLSHHTVSPRLTSLNKLQRVEGNANLCHWSFNDLGDLSNVGGNLSLRDTEISSLGLLSNVGGDLSLPKKFKDSAEVEKIHVGGKITFWNSAKKNVTVDPIQERLSKTVIPIPQWYRSFSSIHLNISLSSPQVSFRHNRFDSATIAVKAFYYYFKWCFLHGRYLDLEGKTTYAAVLLDDLCDQYANKPTALIKYLKNLADNYPQTKMNAIDTILQKGGAFITQQEAISYYKQMSNFSIYIVRYYEDKSGHGLVDSEIALEMARKNVLTQFGQNHEDEIKEIFKNKFNTINNEMGGHFLDLFFDKGLPYKLVEGNYSQDYYRQFYNSVESFERERAFDGYGGGYYWENNYHVVEHAVVEYLSSLLRQSEDQFRESIGIPKIGEGWVSETDLYYKIKEHFSNYCVIQHGRPCWLGRQHLDVYFPDLNIGIEYQGLQHYQPVGYFGGEKGFSATKERDKRKYNLCKKNGCRLLYVDESHTFEEVAEAIQRIIDE